MQDPNPSQPEWMQEGGDPHEALLRDFPNLADSDREMDDSAWQALAEAAGRLADNYPYHSPLYAGQMLKPPHPLARRAYALAMRLNPNNHALDGGRASSTMEKEAVEAIARMAGFETHLGHLCGGGTMANLEALWIARELKPGAALAASELAHYTHRRLAGVLGMPFRPVPVDRFGRMDLAALESLCGDGEIGIVAATAGTTASGSLDPLPDILELGAKFGFRVHVDAAYGGYFTLAENMSPYARSVFDSFARADSLVIDPHKHGLQPYGCGCVLFRDPGVGRFYRHDSPYTYFTSSALHLGEISLECSRPGAAAAALWATQRALPLERGGRFAAGLDASHEAAREMHKRLSDDTRFLTAFPPELDIVFWGLRAESASKSSSLARAVFDEAAARGLHLALASFPATLLRNWFDIQWDLDSVTCLRSCLMKPDHLIWIDRIWALLAESADSALS